MSAEEVTEACEALLAVARHHDCPHWLLDGRASPREQPRELHQWLREEYLPRAMRTLQQPLSVAFLVRPTVRHGLASLGYPAATEWYPEIGHLGWFADEAPARAWLAQQRRS